MLNDVFNALFEFGGSIVGFINVAKLIKDKAVKGVYYPVWIFYTLWGFWNLYYYPSVDCWYSFLGGLFLVLSNLIWVILAIKYRHNQ
jgi:hypothetical protein